MAQNNNSANATTVTDFDQQKTLAHYQIVFQAFIETRLEIDKQLLTISTGGIGLLIGVHEKLMTSTVATNFFYASVVLFLFVALLVLHILNRNTDYLIAELADQKQADLMTGELKCKDQFAKIGFFLAIACATLTLIFK